MGCSGYVIIHGYTNYIVSSIQPPPLLQVPEHSEPLILYLSCGKKVIGAIGLTGFRVILEYWRQVFG